MRRTYRGIDLMGAGIAKQFLIAILFSLAFLAAGGAPALAFECIDCHNQDNGIPAPHNACCNEMSCAQACHANEDSIRHPSGWGTPITPDRTTTCRTCHDRPFPGVYHPYSINVSAGSITPPGSIDLDQACGQCHGGGTDSAGNPPAPGIPYYTKTSLAAFAGNIHGTKPIASFSVTYDAAITYKVNFNATLTTCPSGTCTYSWDFGDTATGAGVTTSHSYPDGTQRTVVLTVDDTVNRTTGTKTQNVTPQLVNHAPAASFAKAFDANTWTATVTDTSTDAEGNIKSGGIRMLWGDGASSTGNAGDVFAHPYTSAGTFTINLRATDMGDLYSEATDTVSPASFSITGSVLLYAGASSSLDDSVLITLKQGATTVANSYTNTSGAYSFTNVKPGIYSATAYKSGIVFVSPTLSGIVVGPNSTGNNFQIQKNKFKITSTALGSGGAPIAGVTITVKNASNVTVAQGLTNAGGVYATGTTLNAGSYNVTATKFGRVFSSTPQSITFANGDADGSLTFNSTTP